MTPGAVFERAERIALVRSDSVADSGALRRALIDARQVKAWADAQVAGLIGQLKQVESFPEAAIAETSKCSLGQATKERERSDTLAATPDLAAALSDGAVTAGSVDQFSKRLELEIRRLQAESGDDRLTRQQKDTRLSTWTDQDGMWNVRGRFDPVTGLGLSAKIDNAIQALSAEHRPEHCPTAHHHSKLHDSGWNIELGPHRQLTVTLPDGHIMNTGPPKRSAA